MRPRSLGVVQKGSFLFFYSIFGPKEISKLGHIPHLSGGGSSYNYYSVLLPEVSAGGEPNEHHDAQNAVVG